MTNCKKLGAALCAALTLTAALPLSAAAETQQDPADLAAAIETYAAEHKDDYVSFAVAAANADELLYTGAFGYADREAGTEADADTVYEWGSVSKTIVWVSVMQLWEQGKLDLEQDITAYLPDGFLHNLSYDQPITMLNLMNHTAGWGEGSWALQTDDANAVPSLKDALSDTEPAQLLPPGTTSSYSNWGAALAAYIVECVSGEDYADYVHTHIFEPLGMEQTAVRPAHEDNAWVQAQREKLICYDFTGADWINGGAKLAYITLYPAGSVTGTVSDMARYAQSFLQSPCPLFAEPDTLNELLSPSLFVGNTDYPSVCHGFFPEEHAGSMTYGHNGATIGCMTEMRFDPERGTAVCVMTNSPGYVTMEVRNVVLGDPTTELVDKLSQDISEHHDISGIAFNVRSNWRGPLKVIGITGVLPIQKTGEDTYDVLGMADVRQISNSIFLIDIDDTPYVTSYRTAPDGSWILDLGAQSYMLDSGMLLSLVTLVLYILLLIIGCLLLLIKLIQRIVKKRKKYIGAGWMTAAQLMRIVSAAALIFLVSGYEKNYGILRATCYAVCGIEAVCLLIFVCATVSSLRGLFTKNPERAGRFKYFVNFLANGCSVFAVIALELVRFWGI